MLLFFKVEDSEWDQLMSYRTDYQNYRRGFAQGARGEITECMTNHYLSNADIERRVIKLFSPAAVGDEDNKKIEDLVDEASREFIEAKNFSTPHVPELEIAARFQKSQMPTDPADVEGYFHDLIRNVVEDGIHTSCPQMIGHMTSALPNFCPMLSKLMVSMNQNVVKTETAKTVTFLEREALAQLHKCLYEDSPAFYAKHVQNPGSMLGLFTNGGTMANVSAMWVARNHSLGPVDDADGKRIFDGVEKTGLPKALRHYGYDDAIVIGSALMHYSMNKAADVLGCGLQALVKIPCDKNYRVDMEAMEARIIQAKANKECIIGLIGICGTTETGAIDPLDDMAALAAKYDIHFHVDAAWGGPCIFSNTHRFKCKGIELADSVTLDGHKQLWLPMGAGMVFFKDPYRCLCVRKTANYIIRKESYDLGKFTIDGSRGGNALFLHANLQLLGLRGYEVLIDRTVRVAQYMARRVLRSRNFELVVKPMMNILLYRWIPASMRDKVWAGELTLDDQKYIDECNRRLQDRQKGEGRTFVSRTTINAPQYDQTPIVALRVVIGNPLTTEKNIDNVLDDQADIIDAGEVTKDFNNEHLFHTEHCADEPPKMANALRQVSSSNGLSSIDETETFNNYWEKVWEQMPRKNRFLFNDDMDLFFDTLSTPDCFLMDQDTKPLVRKESHAPLSESESPRSASAKAQLP